MSFTFFANFAIIWANFEEVRNLNIAVWTVISIALSSLSIEMEKKNIMRLKDFREIKVAPEIVRKISNIDFDRLEKSSFSVEVERFVDVVTKNLPKSNLDTLYNNINTLEIKTVPFLHRSLGRYDSTKNTIVLRKTLEECIYHELFHMASSKLIDENKLYSGFEQIDKKFMIGVGINEGYTQFLTERYFHDYTSLDVYPLHTLAVSIIEKIIGKDNMQNFYFRNDLKSLVEALEKYCSIEEIMQFLNNLDSLTPVFNNRPFDSKKVNKVYLFLARICSARLKEDLEKTSNIDSYFSIIKDFFASVADERNDYLTDDLVQNINQAIEEKRKVYQKKKDIVL